MLKNIFSVFIIVTVLTSCSIKDKPDISTIHIQQHFFRFDKDIYNFPTNDNSDSLIILLSKKYSKFLEMYCFQIINIGNPFSMDFPDHLKTFKEDYVVSQVYDKVEKEFEDLTELKEDFNTAFRYYTYYFPDKPIPDIYTFVSGFNMAVVTDDSILAIGLDFYLGSHCKFYQQLALPQYIIRKMIPEMILPDAMHAWLTTTFEQKDTTGNMLNNMIYYGKLQYVMTKIFPDMADSLRFGYSQKKMEWCKDNENRMWTYFIEHKLFFKTDHMLIKKFIDEGPFTIPFGPDSPPRTGVWLGYRIISAYMKNNPSVTLLQLMNENDYQKILTLSTYNP
ncbi:MAG TPA: hypothetical protein EYP69_06505 [Bacteroidales bacterium]|nr:hypothetical protein [Bacteroidales bacterium]